MHVCKKPGHACYRKIVSFVQHPLRTLYRRGGRAIKILLNCKVKHWSVTNLKVATTEVREAFNQLVESPICVCCGKAIDSDSISMLVVDAAQMYEVIPRETVISNARVLISRIRSDQGVLVWHTPHLAGHVCRKPPVVPMASSWYDGVTMIAVIALVLAQCIVFCGGFTWEQLDGVPIGGVLSSVLAGLVLGMAEERWEALWPHEYHFRYLPPGQTRSQTFAALRYEDDLLLGTRSICNVDKHGCLEKVSKWVYPVEFDPSDRGRQCIWTDLHITALGGNEIRIQPKQASMISFWTDMVNDKLNVSTPPWLDCYVRDPTILSGMLAGRLSRLNQMQLSPRVYMEAIACDVIKWLIAGYPVRVLEALYRPVRVVGAQHVRKFLCRIKERVRLAP